MRAKHAKVERTAMCLSVRDLTRAGLLKVGGRRTVPVEWRHAWPRVNRGAVTVDLSSLANPTVRIVYDLGVADRRAAERLSLDATPQPFGGCRWWLLCRSCERRAATIYCPERWKGFLCRLCHGLVYQSQRDAVARRWERRARKIVDRLGGDADDGRVYKPKWMRWATFNRLMDEARNWDDAAFCYSIRGAMKPHGAISRVMYGRQR